MSQQNINVKVKGAAKGPRNACLKAENKILNFRNGTVETGDIFYSSWGYEQTNINFYQVTHLKGKSTVVVQEIRCQQITASGAMSGTVEPIKGDFIGDPLTRRVKECAQVPMIVIDECENAYKKTDAKKFYYSSYG